MCRPGPGRGQREAKADRRDDSDGDDRSFAAQKAATHKPDRNQPVDHQADKSRRQKPPAQIDRRHERRGAFMHDERRIVRGKQLLPRARA